MASSGCAVVILTKNEAGEIKSAIGSVRGWAAGIVVVDSGSTDNTVAVAQEAGATVLVHEPDGPFVIAEQRNWALDHLPVDADWVLFLDADERATAPFLAEVGRAIERDYHSAYYAAPKFMYQGTWLRRFTGFPNWHPRIVKVSDTRVCGEVWEDFPEGANTGYIREPYLHFPNAKGLPDWIARHSRYAQFEAAEDSLRASPRRRILRQAANRLGPVRPAAALFYYLIVRRGILDRGSVWSYARRMLVYELMIAEARRELTRDRGMLPR